MASWNDTVIADFRSNGGVVGGPFEGKQLVLLHTLGRRSGAEYVTPLVAAPESAEFVLCGSAAGAPTDPQWVGNLEAGSGTTTIEVGEKTVEADYTVIRSGDADWEHLYGTWKAYWPDAADYETKTDRKFPVVRVRPRD